MAAHPPAAGTRPRFVATRRLGAVTAPVLLALAIPLAAQAAAPAAPTPLVTLSANVLPGLGHLTPAVAPAGRRLTIALGVARPDPAGESAYLREISNPHSPSFGRYLSGPAFDARFGVPQRTRDAITAWLAGGGLHIVSVGPSGDSVVADGSVAEVDALFGVTERSYTSNGRSFIANDAAPSVPAGLGITTVMGLNTWQRAVVPQQRGASASRRAQGGCQAQAATGFCTGVLKAEELWSIYDLPAGHKGAGQSIAILGEGVLGPESQTGTVLNDLRQFEKLHSFPQIPVTVHCVINNSCGTDTSGSTEWDLDEDATTGMAPDADHLDFYFAQDLSDVGQLAMVQGWLADPHGPMQANASFSECEQGPYNSIIYNPVLGPVNVDGGGTIGGLPIGTQLGDNLEAALEPTLQKAAMQGKTLFAAAGDTGNGCTALVAGPAGGANGVAEQPVPLNPYPAGARYAVAVGGTVLYGDGSPATKRVMEYSWTYTGGGSSPFLTAPDYQHNVAAITGTCVTDPNGGTGVTGQLCRGVPDVAAMSGDLTNGYEIYSGGADTSNGGTSLSSPLNVGFWTTIQAAVGRNLGFANFTWYAIGKDPTRYAKDFYDVTTGTNGLACPGGPCIAKAGWDYVSGWGVPDVAHVIADVAAAPAPVVSFPPIAVTNPTSLPPGLVNTAGAPGPAGSPWVALGVTAVALGVMARRRRARTSEHSATAGR